MEPEIVGLASIVLMILFIQAGIHIAIVLMALSFVATWIIKQDINVAGSLVAKAAESSIQSYSFGVIPLFIAMGVLVSVSGVGKDTFDVAGQAFRRIRGGLGMATVAANAVFAAINGSSIASASVFTRLAVPELIRLGYSPRFSVGMVAGSSVLGMLIPPSLLLIFFGIVAEVSIGDLFTAGILPGLLLSATFIALIFLIVRVFPRFAAKRDLRNTGPETSFSPLQLLVKIVPIAVIITIVLGGIYGGVFTPVEAGAVGALAALLVSLVKKSLTLSSLWRTLTETGHVTASICLLIIAAHLYANMLSLSGLPNALGGWIADAQLDLGHLLIAYLVIIILLGAILDAISIILVSLPLVQPIMIAQDVNMIWFGIVTIIAVEIGLLTPPLGLSVFVIKSNLDDPNISLNDIFIGAAPFALAMLVVLGMIVAFPSIALFLVN